MKIGGFWSGHDCSFCVLDDGVPTIHCEYERLLREKEPSGDSVSIYKQFFNLDDLDHAATVHPISKLNQQPSWSELQNKFKDRFHIFSHHQAHAAHGFYTSPYTNATIITVDGGGVETSDGIETATTVWTGEDNKIVRRVTIPSHIMNIGGLWTRVTRYVFKLQNGWPKGDQSGTVMAMAAVGDPNRFHDDFIRMLTTDIMPASMKPRDQPKGAYTGNDPVHPYLDKWGKIAIESEQARFDLAAGLQSATEKVFFDFFENLLSKNTWMPRNVVVSGGVSLNTVMMGKLHNSGVVDSCYVPPVPYDGGLCIGAAQLVHHEVLNEPRNFKKWSPHLGFQYNKTNIVESIQQHNDIVAEEITDEVVIDLLMSQKIIAIYGGKSESGRRALGNRSIFADPRNKDMKNFVNEKVKHRQWFRPFAPAVMSEYVDDWFVNAPDSPYMGFVARFRDDKKDLVPAVVHIDGTGRLQVVDSETYPWFHKFLTRWNEKTGVPIILNTSFNDSEPICETPDHAIRCFLKTNIDHVYFSDFGILVSKK